MGYNIKIGNATPFFSKIDGELYAKWRVDACQNDEAPKFAGDPGTGKTNCRYPSYSSWSKFFDATNLRTMFYGGEDVDGLMARHPGCETLTQEHVDEVNAALVRYRGLYPDLTPGFTNYVYPGHPTDEQCAAANLASLIWLQYWVSWAVKNCETPAIENS